MIASPPMNTRWTPVRFAIRGACFWVGLCVWLSSPPAVCAQGSGDPLAAGRAEMEAARFSEAVRLFDEVAAAGSGLDAVLLAELLQQRALARSALRDAEGARADLAALLSLQPDAQLGDEAPPSLRRLVEEARDLVSGPLAIEAEATRIPDGFEVRVQAQNDPGQLVRTIRVLELGDGGVEVHEGNPARIVGEGDLRYIVEAIGPGGAIVARLGTPAEPRELRSSMLAASEVAEGSGVAESGGDDLALWIGLGAGAALVIGAVLSIVLLVTPSDQTRLLSPMCTGCTP